jgi:PAS domain S-box-containing protein
MSEAGLPSIELAAEKPRDESRTELLIGSIVEDYPAATRVAWLIGAIAVATLASWLRVVLGFSPLGPPLVFYLPAIFIVTLIAGWGYGAVAAVISLFMSWVLFTPPPLSFQMPNWAQTTGYISWALVAVIEVGIAQTLRIALRRAFHSETRYRKLLNVASGLVWITDEDGRALSAQPEWSQLTGMPWQEYQEYGWLKAIHPDDQARLRPEDPSISRVDTHNSDVRLWSAAAGDWRWFQSRAALLPKRNGDGEEWIMALRDVHDQRLARDKRDLMVGELRHRLKNLVTIIDALAKNSKIPDEPAVDQYLKKFLGRLHALGAAGDLVLVGQRMAIETGAVVRATLAPFMADNSARFYIAGPVLQLSEETGGTLALAVHELATNAIKYGALSVPEGRVSLTWSRSPIAGGERILIEWKERGGPTPLPPNKEGFGSRVIRFVVAREKDGSVDIDYETDGLRCRIAFTKASEGPPANVAAQ